VLLEQIPLDQMPLDQTALEQMLLDQILFEHLPLEQMLLEQTPFEQKNNHRFGVISTLGVEKSLPGWQLLMRGLNEKPC